MGEEVGGGDVWSDVGLRTVAWARFDEVCWVYVCVVSMPWGGGEKGCMGAEVCGQHLGG